MVHLVWDWNGTLLDDLALVVAATNASLAAAGGPPITAEEHRRDFCRPIALYYSRTLGRPVDEAEFAELDRIFHAAYLDGMRGAPLAAGALDVLATWAGTQSLLSMWFHRDLVPAVGAHGIDGYFIGVDGLKASLGGGSKAPHLATHLASLGLSGADCVLIGDSVDDAEAAASVGAGCVLYSGGYTDTERLRATGRPVVGTLSEAVALAARHGNGYRRPIVAASPLPPDPGGADVTG